MLDNPKFYPLIIYIIYGIQNIGTTNIIAECTKYSEKTLTVGWANGVFTFDPTSDTWEYLSENEATVDSNGLPNGFYELIYNEAKPEPIIFDTLGVRANRTPGGASENKNNSHQYIIEVHGSEVTIEFYTDSSVTSAGFDIKCELVDDPNRPYKYGLGMKANQDDDNVQLLSIFEYSELEGITSYAFIDNVLRSIHLPFGGMYNTNIFFGIEYTSEFRSTISQIYVYAVKHLDQKISIFLIPCYYSSK